MLCATIPLHLNIIHFEGLSFSANERLISTYTMEKEIAVQVATELPISIAPEEDRRILRKLDKILLSQLFICCFWAGLDKAAMPHAAILGLLKDLRVNGHDYSWAGTIYSFGWLASAYPVSIILVKLPVGKFLAVITIAWAIITLSTLSLHSAGGLLITRFFLGFAEGAYIPATLVIIAMFYKAEEQPLRLGIWICGNMVAGAVGNIIPAAIVHVHSIAPWKVLFLVCGVGTMMWGVTLVFLMPNTPMTAWFLNEEDRVKAVLRVESNKTGIKNNEWKKYQVIEALMEPTTWMLVVYNITTNIINSGTANFSSIIVKGMGFSTVNTFLVQLIPLSIQVASILISCLLCYYFKNTRIIWVSVGMAMTIAGAVMYRTIPHSHLWARFSGICMMGFGGNTSVLMYSITTSNTAGFTKKTTVGSIIMIAYATGGLIGPQCFFAREAPDYPSGFLALMISAAILLVSCLSIRFYLARENSRRDRLCRGSSVLPERGEDAKIPAELMDKTDREIPEFRYLY